MTRAKLDPWVSPATICRGILDAEASNKADVLRRLEGHGFTPALALETVRSVLADRSYAAMERERDARAGRTWPAPATIRDLYNGGRRGLP